MKAVDSSSMSLDVLQRMREDFPFFAKTCLKIRTKEGELVPLVLNPAQRYFHEAIEKQKREKGWVRALVLKARQQGLSTYIEARNYHRTSLWRNVNSYILTHEQPASDKLFEMFDRFQRNNPIAPKVGVSNVKQLVFERLQSKVEVATAGSKAGGRGGTLTLFHGSEVAFWPNASEHFAASVQAVPLLPGTEVVLESTANGPSGEFYERWQDAVAGRDDYIAIFIPWFWSPEYYREPEPGFELNPEAEDGELSELEYAQMFNLSMGQMRWRRSKISEFKSIARFRQEYPATPEEAFVSADKRSFIDPIVVLRARKRTVKSSGPLILGVDPAGAGGDRFAVAFRRGYTIEKVIYRDKIDATEAVAWLKALIDDHKPAKMFVDSGGLGHSIISFLRSAGPKYSQVVGSVNFGSKSQHKHAYPKVAGPKNRRAEMWQRMKEWLEQDEGVSIPDDDAIQADMTGPAVKNDLNNDLILQSKEEMRQKGIRSPDLADAIALTFAESVYVPSVNSKIVNPAENVYAFDSPERPAYSFDGRPPAGAGWGLNGWMR